MQQEPIGSQGKLWVRAGGLHLLPTARRGLTRDNALQRILKLEKLLAPIKTLKGTDCQDLWQMSVGRYISLSPLTAPKCTVASVHSFSPPFETPFCKQGSKQRTEVSSSGLYCRDMVQTVH